MDALPLRVFTHCCEASFKVSEQSSTFLGFSAMVIPCQDALRILAAARRMTLALSGYSFALAVLAQSPSADNFNPGVGPAYGHIFCIAVQPDGKIVAGGDFTTLGDRNRTNLGWLNADGTLDSRFAPEVSPGEFSVAFWPCSRTERFWWVGDSAHSLGGVALALAG